MTPILKTLPALAVLAALGAPALADEMERGRDLAARLCAGCHMNPGQGEKIAPQEIPGFAAVANRPGQNLEGITRWLRSVPPMMPDHHLSQDEIFQLAQFIISLRKP